MMLNGVSINKKESKQEKDEHKSRRRDLLLLKVNQEQRNTMKIKRRAIRKEEGMDGIGQAVW